MKLSTQHFLTHLVSALLAAATGVLFMTAEHQGIKAACAAAFPLAIVLPSAWITWRINSRIRSFSRRLDAQEPVHNFQCGLREIDDLVHRIHDSVEWDRESWKGVQKLLEQMAPKSAQNGSAKRIVVNGRLLTQVLARISRAIGAEVGRILNHVNTISQKSHESAHDAQSQSRTIDETIAHVETLSKNIDEILTHAESANNSAADARDAAVQGQQLVEKLIEGMQRIRSHVEAGERKVLSLGERSQEISSIVETMSTLSSRTDILALNASIEAVRAGEQGSGFAVVADEVRKLAEHTNNASREIAELVEAIQIETQDTIKMMAEERAQVQEEAMRVSEAGTALELIRQTSSDSAERVSEISRITLDQLRGTKEIIEGMQGVSTLSDGVYERAVFVRQSAIDLISVTRDLEQWISPMFHCDEDSRRPREFVSETLRAGAAAAETDPAPARQLVDVEG